MRGRRRLRRRRRQLRRPGRAELRPARQAGRAASSAAPTLLSHDVAVPRRPDRGRRPTSRCAAAPRWSPADGDGPPRAAHARRSRHRATRGGARPPGCSCSSAPSPRTDWLGDEVARDAHGFVLTGPELVDLGTARWPLARRAVRARDEHAGRLRRRRRPAGLDEAGRLGRRRGCDVDLPGPPLPGDDLMRRSMDIDELRASSCSTGLTDDQLARARRRRRARCRSSRATCCSRGRARRLLVGAARRGRSTWSGRSAARTPWSPGWTCRAAGPAASGPGTSNGIYLATGRGATPGACSGSTRRRLRELVDRWFPLAGHLIGGLHHTARSIESTVRQRDALVTLGTLAAGLAHEINNPAAAASRTVDELGQCCDALLDGADPAGPRRHHGRPVQRARRAARELDAEPGRTRRRWHSPTARATLAGWLERPRRSRRRGGSRRRWPPAGSTSPGASARTRLLGDRRSTPGLRVGVGDDRRRKTLLGELKDADRRISELVAAVRSYSQMDRASAQRIDVRDGLESTLMMLGHKLKGGVTVVREYADAARRSTPTPASSTRSGPT